MKLVKIQIHNFRSIIDATIEVGNYTLLVGENNAGKSNLIDALRTFYDDRKWSENDFPKIGATDETSWIQVTFSLSAETYNNFKKDGIYVPENRIFILKRVFKQIKNDTRKIKIYPYTYLDKKSCEQPFYGKNYTHIEIAKTKIGKLIYIPSPASIKPSEHIKTSAKSPFRDILNSLVEKAAQNDGAFENLKSAFDAFNSKSKENSGFLMPILQPLNAAIEGWGIKMNLEINPIKLEHISKFLVECKFTDEFLDKHSLGLESYGDGFQRAMIYELIQVISKISEDKFEQNKTDKVEQQENPYILLLFEEPEIFLHPNQQENMAYSLQKFASDPKQQVVVATHAPIFASKNIKDIEQIIRIKRIEGKSKLFQIDKEMFEKICSQNKEMLEIINNNNSIDDLDINQKTQKIPTECTDNLLTNVEQFRFQFWLDSDRSTLFFANKVLLVEGQTEKVLFDYLLTNNWSDLRGQHIDVIDVFGKYNFHRFMLLMKAYGIEHGVIFDDDLDKNNHNKEKNNTINTIIKNSINEYTLAEPVAIPSNIEVFLNLEQCSKRKGDKPLYMIQAMEQKTISEEKLQALRAKFCEALKISDTSS